MNSEIVDKLNDMTKELTSKIDNSESRLFSKLELELKPLVNQTFEKILDANIARYHARMSEIFEKDSQSLNFSHQKMDYMIQQIQSMGNEVKALDSRLEKLESKLESFSHENAELKESSRINSDISVETEDCAITVSESDTTDDSSILELDETDRIQVSDTVVMFRRKNLTKHNNVYEGEISSSLLDIRRCAIKFPRESSQRDEEVSILEKLGSHSHVNCLIQSGVFDDGPIKSRFLVLELCYKENLDQFLRNEPYDLQQRLEYCTQIMKGMNYIHKKMIIHKDLKPANILLALDNLQCIKIADFGISQEIQSEHSMVYCENCFGTIGYHPPESFGNNYISLKSDIFSLGVLFHFVMTEEESPFGPASDLWDSNIKKGIVDITLQFVPNPIAFAHLFKLMMSKYRGSRPTIRQVEKHPCWTLQEEDCDFDYGFMDEVDLSRERRDSSPLEDVDSTDDHGRLMELLAVLAEQNAVEEIRKDADRRTLKSVIEDPIIERLTNWERYQILEIVKRCNVRLSLMKNKYLGTHLIFEGAIEDVRKAQDQANDVIVEFAAAETRATYVVWQEKSKSDEWKDLSPRSSSDLEEAYRNWSKNQKSVSGHVKIRCFHAGEVMMQNYDLSEATSPEGRIRRRIRERNISDVPLNWGDMGDKELVVTDLSASSLVYQDVLRKFTSGSRIFHTNIVSIKRVQNVLLYKRYYAMKRHISHKLQGFKQPINRRLFYGNGSDDKIIQHGFDRSFSGRKANVYGYGVYFAVDPAYAHHYSPPNQAGERRMVLSDVVTGEFCVGNRNFKVPPLKQTSSIANDIYDSVVDNLANPQIFVIFRDASAYPAYVITYK